MPFSITALEQHIPQNAPRVKKLFSYATSCPHNARYSSITSRLYALEAALFSIVNTALYALLSPFHAISRPQEQRWEDLTHARQSLQFGGTMVMFVALSCINHRFSLAQHTIQKPEQNAPVVRMKQGENVILESEDQELIDESDRVIVVIDDQQSLTLSRTSSVFVDLVTSQTIQLPSSLDTNLEDSFRLMQSTHIQKMQLVREPFPTPTTTHIISTYVPPQPRWTFWSQLKNMVAGSEHVMKEMKYRYALDSYSNVLASPEGAHLVGECRQLSDSPLMNVCLDIIGILTTQDTLRFPQERDRYKAVVSKLRQGNLIIASTQDVSPPAQLIRLLSYERFYGVSLYGYCRALVTDISGSFDNLELSLDNFWQELTRRNREVDHMPLAKGTSSIARTLQKVRGHVNTLFDPLLAGNVPYIYGTWTLGDQTIRILRHGTPIVQLTPFSEAVVNPDYIAFIEAAGGLEQNILHVIFENGDRKYHGDESARVQARLNLARYPNFFPIAFRMDGPFFEPPFYTSETFHALKERLIKELLGDLNTTGFFIPEKIERACENGIKDTLRQALDNVQEIYFAELDNCTSKEQFQAFVLLSYVQITRMFCNILNIKILEAHCKDDMDRGGAFKAILSLDSLYRSGTLTPSNLEALMIQIIAAPLTVKKQPILARRNIFIRHVIEVIKHQEGLMQADQTLSLTGAPSFQSITPVTGAVCRTQEEYQEFLEHITLESTYDSNTLEIIDRNIPELEVINNGNTLPPEVWQQDTQQAVHRARFYRIINIVEHVVRETVENPLLGYTTKKQQHQLHLDDNKPWFIKHSVTIFDTEGEEQATFYAVSSPGENDSLVLKMGRASAPSND